MIKTFYHQPPEDSCRSPATNLAQVCFLLLILLWVPVARNQIAWFDTSHVTWSSVEHLTCHLRFLDFSPLGKYKIVPLSHAVVIWIKKVNVYKIRSAVLTWITTHSHISSICSRLPKGHFPELLPNPPPPLIVGKFNIFFPYHGNIQSGLSHIRFPQEFPDQFHPYLKVIFFI